jgi:chromosome segregation ATPase
MTAEDLAISLSQQVAALMAERDAEREMVKALEVDLSSARGQLGAWRSAASELRRERDAAEAKARKYSDDWTVAVQEYGSRVAEAEAALAAEREAHEKTRALARQLGDLAARGGRGSDLECDAYELLEKLEVPRG